MADFSKYGATSVGRLFLHNNRMSGDGVHHSNESIDDERTVYNYHLKQGSVSDVQKRLSEIYTLKKNNATILGEMVVTLPADVPREDERDFFEAVYDFYAQDLGEENIMNAVVHKDEKTPHLHLDFVPVVPMEETAETVKYAKDRYQEWIDTHGHEPKEKLCCKDKISRSYMETMHQRLSDFVEERLGYRTGILNGATINGNRSVLQLKADTLRQEVEKLERQREHLGKEIQSMLTLAKNNGMSKDDVGLYPLMQKIEDLAHQNAVLKNVITRQGYSWKREELEDLKSKKYTPSKSVSVNIYDGKLIDADIDKNAILVIELPDKVSRPSPQKLLIEQDGDLERQAAFVSSSAKQVMCRQSRVSDRIYLFVKTDTTQQTMENLLLLEKQLRELGEARKGRRIFMERISNDDYDVARNVLMKNDFEALYFTGRTEELVKDGEREEPNLNKDKGE